jgi:formyl-CoA transferase
MVGSGVYPAADGFFFFTAGVQYIVQMIHMIGLPELLEQPEWSTPDARAHPDRIAEFPQYLLPWSVTRTMSEIRAACQEFGVLGGPLNTIPALLADPSFVERQFFQQIEHPVAGTQTYPGFHFALQRAGEPMPARRRAPLLGEHTEAVLCSELRVSAQELAELRRQGVA